MATEKQHALYLVKEGEHPKLFHGDDVADARADGWSEPDFQRSNGADWNPQEEAAQRDAAASLVKQGEEAAAKQAKSAAKEEAKAAPAKKSAK